MGPKRENDVFRRCIRGLKSKVDVIMIINSNEKLNLSETKDYVAGRGKLMTPQHLRRRPRRGNPRKVTTFSTLNLTKNTTKQFAGEEEEEPETTFSDYDSAGGSTEPLRKNKGKDSPVRA